MLTNISLGPDHTLDSYLRSIKTIADALVVIQSPILDLELIQLTTARLPEDYDSFLLHSPCFLVQSPLMIYELNCWFMNNVLISRKIIICLFIKPSLPLLGTHKVKGVLNGMVITKAIRTIVIRGSWAQSLKQQQEEEWEFTAFSVSAKCLLECADITVLCDSVNLSFSTYSSPAPVTNDFSVRANQFERILGFSPNIVC